MRLLTAIFVFIASIGGFAMQRVELTELTQVGVHPAYYIVKQDISGGTATFAAGSVLAFEGGTLHGCDISGDFTVSAAEYQIFDAETTVKGLRNATVPAAWFGPVDEASASATINRAIQMCGKTTLGSGIYTLNSPILLSDRQSFKCSGTLKITKDIPAIVMHGINIEVDVDLISGNGSGTAVLLCENTYNGRVNVNNINGVTRGFDLSPCTLKYKSVTDKLDYCGIQYTKFNWLVIRATYPIYVDPWAKKGSDINSSWVSECQFYGGRVMGDYGFYMPPVDGKDMAHSHPCSQLSLYDIGFEGIKKMALRFENCVFNHCYGLRMSESLPETGPYISLKNTYLCDIDIKSGIPQSRIQAESGCWGVNLHGLFMNDKLDIYNDYEDIAIVCDPTSKDKTSHLLLVNNKNPYSTAPNITIKENTSTDFLWLFKDTAKRNVLSTTSVVYILPGKTLTVDMSSLEYLGGKNASVVIQYIGIGDLVLKGKHRTFTLNKPGYYKLYVRSDYIYLENLAEPTNLEPI